MTPGQRKNWPVGSKPEVRNGLQDSKSETISVEEALPSQGSNNRQDIFRQLFPRPGFSRGPQSQMQPRSTRPIRVGTRGSRLALAQTALAIACPRKR